MLGCFKSFLGKIWTKPTAGPLLPKYRLKQPSILNENNPVYVILPLCKENIFSYTLTVNIINHLIYIYILS